ncbi:potassium transporter Kup [Ralstonia mannitolilytica]|uniref:potassium transporter Kup n=1 Tax=Ralstonia mannitolilytica TaxID=105219 RepID=UPI0005D94443|nr:potassium transporter Kup [Ralstonia mannitolilytica]AJW47318.1 potassium transport protein Kup [Ralstonia mannitolilytica]QIF09668.1 potassium transporter Kup [Ralstonia mannitolilytica]
MTTAAASTTTKKPALMATMMGAIGVVFGDIGTSPLYALKECFNPEHGVPFSDQTVYGILSMLFWAMTLVVSIKYVLFVMRADNNGEGGILALTALAMRASSGSARFTRTLMLLGLLGAAMFYGDAVITPAISVLSAIEGMEIMAPALQAWVLPLALVVLIGLFLLQKHGTHVVGRLFGPIMLLWFVLLGLLGLISVVQSPQILVALNPLYAIEFGFRHTMQAFVVFGSVFLALTGAEALYADMGHFGARPIRYAWFYIAMPCLLLNYFGQGAMLLREPSAVQNPFFLLMPGWAVGAMVVLATAATVIASQAVISGAFSMTAQAVHLGYAPRMKILYTSDVEIGQIYVPVVNYVVLVLVVAVVLAFGKSDNLAAAYGIAVTTTMVLTTGLVTVVMRNAWKWSLPVVAGLGAVFLAVDLSFFSANLLKIAAGGWFPLLLGGLIFFLMVTWHTGTQLLKARNVEGGIPLEPFMEGLLRHPPHRVDGTAVYLTPSMDFVPLALLHNLKHNHVLHERVLFIHFRTLAVPYVQPAKRLSIKTIGDNIYAAVADFGFKETPAVDEIVKNVGERLGVVFEDMETSFFITRATVVPSPLPGMAMWREALFAWMQHNSAKPSDFFRIPANRLVELGSKVEI